MPEKGLTRDIKGHQRGSPRQGRVGKVFQLKEDPGFPGVLPLTDGALAILNQVLARSGRDEQATMTTLAGLVVVLMMIAQKVAGLFDLVKTLFEF